MRRWLVIVNHRHVYRLHASGVVEAMEVGVGRWRVDPHVQRGELDRGIYDASVTLV
jgi:hypothetical protein